MPGTASATKPAHVLGNLVSMTGFARVAGDADGLSWSWELKSVNGKSLDLRFRLPPGFEALELPLRALIGERMKRGSVSVSLAITRTAAGATLQLGTGTATITAFPTLFTTANTSLNATSTVNYNTITTTSTVAGSVGGVGDPRVSEA